MTGDSAKETREALGTYYLENRARLLAFVVGKVGDEDLAEDILQESFLKALRSAEGVEEPQRLVSWLYSILRNAITDGYRRRAASERRVEAYARAAPPPKVSPTDAAALCACLLGLLPTLRPEYAEVLEAMDLGHAGADEMTVRLGITANNLKVRRYRARRQLRASLERTCRTCARHGCLDCDCRNPT